MSNCLRSTPAWICGCFAIGLCLLGAVPTTTYAEPLVGYQLQVCESLEVLNHPNDMHVAMMAAWVTPGQLLVERSMPYLKLTNTATKKNGGTGSAELTSFTFTIGDTTKQFDWVKIIKTSTGVKVESVNIDKIEGGKASKQITMTFSGLQPGKSVYFQVDIDPVAKNAFPLDDYRMTFFHLNGGPNNAGNSKTKASFFDSSLPAPFQDVTTPYVKWDNPENFKFTNIGMTFHAGYAMDNVTPYMTGNMSTIPVPEPAAIALVSSGVACLWMVRRRRKRQMKAAA